MNLLSWLDVVAGQWTWRHYLVVSAVALAVVAVFVFKAMRQGQAEASAGRLYRRISHAVRACTGRHRTERKRAAAERTGSR